MDLFFVRGEEINSVSTRVSGGFTQKKKSALSEHIDVKSWIRPCTFAFMADRSTVGLAIQ